MKTFELLTPKYLLPEVQLLAIGLKAAWNRFKRAFNARSWWINYLTSSAFDSISVFGR